MSHKRPLSEFDADPELPVKDEEFMDEVFRSMQESGDKPEDLPQEKDRRAYRKWLASH